MNVIDSSGWLEYFADGPNASFFEQPLKEDLTKIIIPAISIYEVFKKVYTEKDEDIAINIIGQMQHFQIIELNTLIALAAAKVSLNYKLPMADSIIYSTAQIYKATLWTQDKDFKGLPGVKYIEKN